METQRFCFTRSHATMTSYQRSSSRSFSKTCVRKDRDRLQPNPLACRLSFRASSPLGANELQNLKTFVRSNHESDSPQSRSLATGRSVIRKSAPADTAPRRLEGSILWLDVEPRGAPSGIPQPLGGRLRGELDYAVLGVSCQSSSPLSPSLRTL